MIADDYLYVFIYIVVQLFSGDECWSKPRVE